MKKQAFTLVELIVVIIILAILGTIAFISLQGYSKDARDATRLSDLNNIKKTLELYALDKNKYPSPDENYGITYSGTQVWTQGTFGSGVLKEIQKLSNVPLDPLTGNGYTYSVLNTGKEYQIGGVFEGGLSKLNSNTTNANGDTLATAYVTGNYNGLAAKTLDGTNCSILAIPSILTSSGTNAGEILNVEEILASKSLVYKGKNNLPYNIAKNTKLKLDGGFDFDNSADLIAYSDSDSCNTLATDSNARQDLYNGLKDSYSGTVIENEKEIYTLLNTTDTDKIISNIVSNSLGGSIIIKKEESIVIDTTPPKDYIAYYPLTGTADDFSGNNYHGTENGGLNYVSDTNYGSVTNFDGVNDTIVLNNDISSLGYNNIFSYSLWFKTSLTNTRQVIISDYDSDGTDSNIDIYAEIDANNNLVVHQRRQGNTSSMSITPSNLNDGAWHNLIIIADGTNISLYIDDIFIDSMLMQTDIYNTVSKLRLGARSYISTDELFFNGNISNVKIFDRALSEQEITNIYNSEKDKSAVAVSDGLVAYYPLKNNSMDNWYNQYDGVDTGTVTYDGISATYDSGEITENNIKILESTNYSISTWLKIPTLTDTNNRFTIYSENKQGWLEYGAMFILSSNIGFSHVRSDSATSNNHVLSNLPNLNTWVNYIVIRNGLNISIYKNGILENSNTLIHNTNISYSTGHFGGTTINNVATYTAPGSLSNLRLYNKTITESEIQEIYNSEKSEFGY